MTAPFTYTANPSRVIFGSGTLARVGEEIERLGLDRVMILTTPYQAEEGQRLAAQLGDRAAGVFGEAAMHTPVDVTERALAEFERSGAAGIVSLGGGSTIGLGKAIALRNDAPQLAVPTTYAGSEMTPIVGQTENERKTTQRTPKVLPETVVYDVDLTLHLPREMTVTSGINAIAHAVEAIYAEGANPVLGLMAEEGIGALMSAIGRLGEEGMGADPEARSDALYGAWLCAVCLGQGGVALHHKLCHVLGGTFDLPHAQTHTVILPHALAYNAPAVPDAMEQLKRATGSASPAAAFYDLAADAGVPTSLRELGMPEDGIDQAVEIALENPYYNPRPLEPEPMRDLLAAAWAGERPA
ncbi:maleylacetate reductase [Pelagerythrobacter marensis]|uniref:Putative maleylacetate reductase n=1 Tax=Pelagerythrobacter marensis TaxID=543877 RepID=A0A0G3X8V2_9SPHN|nr:maleylacetate reductase [Pelagerythrobacter marensis]AKM07019.1 Putative maleylacetate reductase [Pelagerythrobacter marensis]